MPRCRTGVTAPRQPQERLATVAAVPSCNLSLGGQHTEDVLVAGGLRSFGRVVPRTKLSEPCRVEHLAKRPPRFLVHLPRGNAQELREGVTYELGMLQLSPR